MLHVRPVGLHLLSGISVFEEECEFAFADVPHPIRWFAFGIKEPQLAHRLNLAPHSPDSAPCVPARLRSIPAAPPGIAAHAHRSAARRRNREEGRRSAAPFLRWSAAAWSGLSATSARRAAIPACRDARLRGRCVPLSRSPRSNLHTSPRCGLRPSTPPPDRAR